MFAAFFGDDMISPAFFFASSLARRGVLCVIFDISPAASSFSS